MPQHYEQIINNNGLSSVCRLCAENGDPNMTQIFLDGLDTLETKIQNILPIKVCYGDGLPSTICKLCIENLNVTTQFIGDAVTANNSLKKLLTFISEARSVHKKVHRITERTLDLVKLISGNLENMTTLCRLCETRQRPCDMMKIFSAEYNSIEGQITSLIDIKLSEGDGLPDSVCKVCVDKLDAALGFITKTSAIDCMLRNVLFQDVKIKTEINLEQDPQLNKLVKEEPLETDDADEMDWAVSSTLGHNPLVLPMKEEKVEELQPSCTTFHADVRPGYLASCFLNPLALPVKEEILSLINSSCSTLLEIEREHSYSSTVKHEPALESQKHSVTMTPSVSEKCQKNVNVNHRAEMPNLLKKATKRRYQLEFVRKLQPANFTRTPCNIVRRCTVPLVCGICDRNLTTKLDLMQHMKSHTLKRLHPCIEHGKIFTTLQLLVEHERKHHSFTALK